MNVMRKLGILDRVSSSSSAAAAAAAAASTTLTPRTAAAEASEPARPRSSMYEDSSGTTDCTLGLMHLRKLFSELKNPPNACSQKDLENMLYNMLPLFCKVFGSCPASDMLDKFPDVLQFCGHVSRLMVSEIRRRASNQSTDAASLAIVKFLEIDSTEELSNGWMLLCTVNLLSMAADSLIDCMTVASLPSTLVKCLYLFFDLPDLHNADSLAPGCEFTARESRVLLQKVFVQVLVRLCSHMSPAEELARKDDLSLLFSAITSWCPRHNVQWRKSAAEVLITLSRFGLSPNVVQYIHTKACIGVCVDNMQRVQDLSAVELVEMFVTIFCFLKDSSDVSQVLLDDFRAANGYVYLSEFLIQMDRDSDNEETMQALRNLILLSGSLATCGFIELKPSSKLDCLYQMPGFSIPQPVGKGYSVRNLHAFQVLQTVFMKCNSCQLSSTILDVIASIYQQDPTNYFILEPHNTLSQFAEKIYLKPTSIQVKLLEIIEFIVFNLNFVPCKELITISILIKTNHSVSCSILCMNTLHKLIRHHVVYKDVFREVGLIEVMVTCLHRYAALLKDSCPPEGSGLSASDQQLGSLVMDALALLINNNNNNASVFRECGGARCAHNMVPFSVCRSQALAIVQQLVLCAGGDDDLGTLLGLMHTASVQAIPLKMAILKSLLVVLKESHRCRMIFRKVGGFVYVMSVLVSMAGALADPPRTPWESVSRNDVLTIVRLIFCTLTIAMRFEPANARFFATEVRYASLSDAVRLLGCFEADVDVDTIPGNFQPQDQTPFAQLFALAAGTQPLSETSLAAINTLPLCLISATILLRYLYDMALDNYDRSDSQQQQQQGDQQNILSVNTSATEAAFIVHPGAIISMLHLVPAVKSSQHAQLSVDVQWLLCGIIKSVVRTERNQQVMCECLLPHELLSHATLALTDESHVLHQPLQYIFERLAAQSLTPKDLRDFLRLGQPLFCASEDEQLYDERHFMLTAGPTFGATMDKLCSDHDPNNTRKESQLTDHDPVSCRRQQKRSGGPVPLTRVKCLVSMTTPRDVRLHGTAITPSFVEFDMSAEGFGCLYLPSIAPQAAVSPSVVSTGMIGGVDQSVLGGIGTGERSFPPASGLSFSTWLCVDKFSCAQQDPHPVRLLTVVRQCRDDSVVCLSIYLSAYDRSFIISTRETPLSSVAAATTDEEQCETVAKLCCVELSEEGQWHHVVVVFHKASITKNSSVSVFVNASLVSTHKLHYLAPYINTAPNSPSCAVFAYIGTAPLLRRTSRLLWRQGPCHLVEDVISVATIQTIYELGPNYVGSLQAPGAGGAESSGGGGAAVLMEDRLIFAVHAHAMSLMTLAKIRKVYNKVDAKLIAKQLNMSDHENATPIRILHNSVAHLTGPARSFGAILIGYLGVRTFCPKPVAKVIMNIGGTSTLLGLIAMATDVEGLYASVKALVCVVRSNRSAANEMDRIKGYETLAMLFKRKRPLLNSHILHLTFSLVGTLDSGRETSVIQHKTAFENLLCDLEIWHEAPCDLHKSLYEHFYELLTESNERASNMRLMQELGLVSRLLHILNDNNISRATVHTISTLLTVLLSPPVHHTSLLRFGQFVVYLLPASGDQSEVSVPLDRVVDDPEQSTTSQLFDSSADQIVFRIKLRNICLDIIYTLVTSSPSLLNTQFCDDLCKVLGFDWLLVFLQSNVHESSVVLALSTLFAMFAQPALLQSFRESLCGAGWLHGTDPITQNRVGVLLGFNIGGSAVNGGRREVNLDICCVPGFSCLQWLLCQHPHVSDVYFLLMGLLLGQPVKQLPRQLKLDLDSVWMYTFGRPSSCVLPQLTAGKVEICIEAAAVLLSMVRTMLHMKCDSCLKDLSWVKEYPVTVMQFLLYLYHNDADFVPLSMSTEFLSALAATLFPYRTPADSNSELLSPAEDFRPFPSSDPMVLVNFADKSPTVIESINNVNNINNVNSHPVRKFVVDFLRRIVVDSLSLTSAGKASVVIDTILEMSPENSSRQERRSYQTEILNTLMDQLLAADVLLGDQAALPAVTASLSSAAAGPGYTQLSGNVFYLAGRIVDKLWQGTYTRDSNEVFDFLTSLIAQAKRKASGLSLDAVYKSLNRTILYQLSRPINSLSDEMSVLDALHKLTNNRSLILGPGNYDQEFFGCLCYCLLQLTANTPDNISSPRDLRRTTWHVESGRDVINTPGVLCGSDEASQLLAVAAQRVWDELFVCKKPAIEDIFKVTLPTVFDGPCKKPVTPDLNAVRPQISEAAQRLWVQYFENERKRVYSQTERIQSQLQSKLQKVGQGVMRLAIRKGRKDIGMKQQVYISSQEWLQSTAVHVSIVHDLVDLQLSQYQQSKRHVSEYVTENWCLLERELCRERGLWGPPVASDLDKWQLDMTEGPCRMRKKLIRNWMFYSHYPYKTHLRGDVKTKPALCADSKVYYETYRAYSLLEGELVSSPGDCEEVAAAYDSVDTVFGEDTSGPADMALGTPRLLRNLPRQQCTDDYDDDTLLDAVDSAAELSSLGVDDNSTTTQTHSETTDLVSTPTDSTTTNNQIIIRLLEEGEMITHMFRCARIQGLDTVEGLLVFVKEHLYIIDGFTLLRTKEIADIDSLPADVHDPIIPRTSKNSTIKRMCFKMAFDDMREVHKRRYLLQPIAVEVFSADGRNFLLAFPRKIRNKVFDRLQAVGTALTDSARESVSGQKQSAKVEPGTGLISSLMGEKSVTQRWERGEISNFEYLMCLNTLAGRSYNDLMQYPVFPWIIADYDSQELDLNDPATFRDLSRPMGAQTPERLKQFEKRYNDWDDPTGETPPYHYGTHYSSAMIVASYLVRMEPFTQTFLHLQGGHFDLADRMFHSVKDAYLSAAKHNMADVKELIPEFFYLPEFLVNSNHFDLGTKQSGVVLGDVVLPVWAKGDVREFIRVHREALECDYVSSKLNEWIDLIFGYKQQGPAAVEALNVFHHLFYEGNVDIYAIDDPLKRTATIGFINNFGQIPKQLFKKPHPQKKMSVRGLGLSVGPMIQFDRLFFHNVDNLRPAMQPVKELKGAVGQIVESDRHNILAVEQNKALIPPAYSRFIAWGFPDMSIRVGPYDSDKAVTVFESSDDADILCAVCPSSKVFISAGTSTVVNVWEFGKGRERHRVVLKQSLCGHTEAVTCLAASAVYNIIVSGSRDRTCIIWDLNELVFVRQLRGHAAPVAAVCINELTGDIATCAGTYLHLWSINGSEIANINTAVGRNQQILCVAMSQIKEWDASNVIMTGNSDGVVRMWSLEFVEVEDSVCKSVASKVELSSAAGSRLPFSSVQHHNNLSQTECCSSSIDSDSGAGHMLAAVQQWLGAELDRSFDHLTDDTATDRADSRADGRTDSRADGRADSGNTDSRTTEPGSEFWWVTEQDVKERPVGRRRLRDGFRWQKQLVFRSKLTMHTAFERKDNKDPAAVTALAVSRDHKSLYVGDAKGRVFVWSVSEQPGRSVVDHWVKDDGGDSCAQCSSKFSFADRRHHCRNCGQLYCARCSCYEIEIRRLQILRPVRVCQSCYNTLQQQQQQQQQQTFATNPLV